MSLFGQTLGMVGVSQGFFGGLVAAESNDSIPLDARRAMVGELAPRFFGTAGLAQLKAVVPFKWFLPTDEVERLSALAFASVGFGGLVDDYLSLLRCRRVVGDIEIRNFVSECLVRGFCAPSCSQFAQRSRRALSFSARSRQIF